MAQNMNATAAASLGAPPRRLRVDPNLPSESGPGGVGAAGTSMSARYGENEWEARESQRQRELEEARARAAQMEKTMKWWSDCTANWREKWSKVRTERNKARDEAKQLRGNLETAVKEANAYKREKTDLEQQIGQLKKEMEKVHMLMMKHAGQFHPKSDGTDEPDRDGRDAFSPDISSDGLKNVNSEDGLVIKSDADRSGDTRDLDIEEYILQGAVPKHVLESLKDDDRRASAEERRLIQQLSKDDYDEDYMTQKVSVLQQSLDEAQKSLQSERDDRSAVQQTLDKLTHDLQDARDKCEELRGAKQDAVRELLTLQEQQRAELRIINNALHEEQQARVSLERRLGDLRGELERLQAENAAEWGKRERLETEKLALERDNKKLRVELRELQADRSADRRVAAISAGNVAAIGTVSAASGSNIDPVTLRAMQQELVERNKELADARHAYNKLKKLLTETNTELSHAARRAEQYEAEVKRLRGRVEELKRELAGAEDELDASSSHVRRLQRNNEELLAQSDCMQTQLHAAGAAGAAINRLSIISPNKHEPYAPLGSNPSAAAAAVGLAYDGKPNINDLRQMFDNTRYEYKRCNYMQTSAILPSTSSSSAAHGQDAARHAYIDARQSSLDENVFEHLGRSGNQLLQPAAAGAAGATSRNVDFERAKQKFDKPTSLRLSMTSQNALHNQPPLLPTSSSTSATSAAASNRQALGNFLRLGQSSGAAIASRRLVDAAAAKMSTAVAPAMTDDNCGRSSNVVGSDGGRSCEDGEHDVGEVIVGEYFKMTTSMNLDELKVSDDDTS